MTLYLIAWRIAIIVGVTLALAPLETVFDMVEDELVRRGVEL